MGNCRECQVDGCVWVGCVTRVYGCDKFWVAASQEPPRPAGPTEAPGYKSVLEAIEKAQLHVFGLCDGTEKWTMRVPVDEGRDSDCIIMGALQMAKEVIEGL